jgi:hypothetical protein
VKIQVEAWFVTPHSDVVGYQRFWCGVGGSLDLWNVGILPQHYTSSQPRRPGRQL